MNMLTNKIQFGLLSKAEQELFESAGFTQLSVFIKDEWCDKQSSVFNWEKTYCLKLKEGEWYTFEYCGNDYTCKCIDSDTDFIDLSFDIQEDRKDELCSDEPISECDSFRPATQEEIDIMKPKGYVDVEINWDAIEGYVIPPFDYTGRHLCDLKEHSPIHGWVLNCYKFKNEDSLISRKAFKYNSSMTEIVEKATHARFVKLEEKQNVT